MTDALTYLSATTWQEEFSSDIQHQAVTSLESGKILLFPHLAFSLNHFEKNLLSPELVDPKTKNISFHKKTGEIRGAQASTEDQQRLKEMLNRFAQSAENLIHALFPHYVSQLVTARTSFRPVEIKDRPSSYRKDDTRLHVDAFPSSPNQGRRILRVFSNINPSEARVWRVGEPFETVAKRFLPAISKPLPFTASLLHFLGITKTRRTLYDHYMLHIHDNMKADQTYQQQASQQEIRFLPNTTWIVQTDHVSHAAMSGQHLLEQTFYLPVTAMADPTKSPLKVLERLKGFPLA